MDNLKLHKVSDLDPYQMDNRTFDDKKDAWRVSIVDGITLNAESITLPEMKFPELKTIEVPVIVKETVVKEINVPVIVKELQIERIEVPIVVKETEFVYVDRPIIVTEIKVVEIEKPVTVYKNLEIPMVLKVCLIAQTLTTIGILLTNLILKG